MNILETKNKELNIVDDFYNTIKLSIDEEGVNPIMGFIRKNKDKLE